MNSENPNRDTLISAEENRAMFDRIAENYDAANRVISLGLEDGWRRKAVDCLKPLRHGRYLDVGTGTGDFVVEILRRCPDGYVDGIDVSEPMLAVARRKVEQRGMDASFFMADALALPMGNGVYDGIVSGFCFRNIEHRQTALAEMFRVLKPGGRLVILEATSPERILSRIGHRFHLAFVALFGRLLVDAAAYRYLVDSIDYFPPAETVTDMFSAAGFSHVERRSLVMGAVSIFSGRKP